MTQKQSPPYAREVPKPKPEELESQSDDTQSLDEAGRIEERKDIEHKAEINRFRRSERLRNLFWGRMQWLVGIIIWITGIVMVVVAIHHLAPENWGWLTSDQLSDLRTFLFSAAVISTVMSHLQRNL